MSDDVAVRLGAADAAMANIGTYVEARARLGGSGPALTAERAHEWYGAESGLRLDALGSDTVAIESLARAVEDGLEVTRDALGAVLQSWQGDAGSAAAEVVARQCAMGAEVAENLRVAADELRSLRDQLGQLVDQKISVTLRVDGSRADEHPVWLPQARAVLNGTADSADLAGLGQQIAPYVDGDIQGDWVPAMRASSDSIASAYDGAVARMSDRRPGSGAMAAAPAEQSSFSAVPPQPWANNAAPWGSGFSPPALPDVSNLGAGGCPGSRGS